MAGIVRRLVVAALLGPVLAGCALFESKKPPPTEIEIKPAEGEKLDFLVTASPLVNPDPEGTPSVMVVRLYLLNAPTAFTSANFFQLWEKDEATLGPTMLGKHELIVAPSGAQRISTKLLDGTTLIGVVAGFRDFRQAKWRALVPFQGERTLKLKAELKTLSVTVGPQD